ncbi:hypothetical protein H1S01_17015 [Heliobacterium chlorum]|uniref:Uncharacterized protein n=1 Tax=Heliobacterium chlorum TaxID=2698 RepID=A0ABR7T5W7_HELCL|nr:hypothetical protein [Heliobacterium chlorum]MBC9786168.1 hypothetical protein [Heliobacterium chlorum]
MKAEPFIHPEVPREVQSHPLFQRVLPFVNSGNLAEYLAGWTRIYYLRHHPFVCSVDQITPSDMIGFFQETCRD